MDAISIPSAADVRSLLAGFTVQDLRKIALETEVPFGTLYKIATGETTNPGIDTTRRFFAQAVKRSPGWSPAAVGAIVDPHGPAANPPVCVRQAADHQEARDAA